MSNYKNYLLRQLGIKESQLPASIVERDSYPGIDPDELEQGTEDEKDEHGMPLDKAKQTAIQHLEEPDQKHYYSGMEKAKDKGMLKDMLSGITPPGAEQLTSPTAIPTPIIGVSVRGSSSGGLPSGVDQTAKDITPTNLGGYDKVPIETVNSRLIDNTPANSEINSTNTPINDNPKTIVEPHPHQIQNDHGEPPQAVTGASTDSSDELTLKSAMPKGIDIDVSEQNTEEESGKEPVADENPEYTTPNKEGRFGTNLGEVFERNKKLMQDKLGIVSEGKHKAGCTCGFCKNKGSFGKKKEEEQKDVDESKIPVNFKKDDEKGNVPIKSKKSKVDVDFKKDKEFPVKIKEEVYTAPFERMRGLANIGKRKLSSNGLWENVGASEPFNTDWKMDKEKGGMVKVDEVNHTTDAGGNSVIAVGAPGSDARNAVEKGGGKCPHCKDTLKLAVGGPAGKFSCSRCGTSLNINGNTATIRESGKWMQDLSKDAEKKGTKGALHKDLGVPEDKKIPTERLESLKQMLHTKAEKGPLTDKELTLSKRINSALNMRNSNG